MQKNVFWCDGSVRLLMIIEGILKLVQSFLNFVYSFTSLHSYNSRIINFSLDVFFDFFEKGICLFNFFVPAGSARNCFSFVFVLLILRMWIAFVTFILKKIPMLAMG